MATRVNSIKLIHRILDQNPNILNIVEFGNSYLRRDAREWVTTNKFQLEGFTQGVGKAGDIISKEYFEALGYNHTSIDLHGREGCLPLNLCNPIDLQQPALINSADLLIDCGTTQHVQDQYECLMNAFTLTKVGGFIIHVLPLKGYWENHSQYKYTTEFFTELSDNMEYNLIELCELDDLLQVCVQKVESSRVISKPEFEKLPLYIEDTPAALLNDRMLYPYAYEK